MAALAALLLAAGPGTRPADAHPLGWNGIPTDKQIEVTRDSTLGSGWTDIRNSALTKVSNWRTNNALADDGVAVVRKPDPDRFGPTDTVMTRDNSGDFYLQYWDVNFSPDKQGVQTQNSANQKLEDKIATTGHEWLHAEGGDHHPDCLAALLAPFGDCGSYENNSRRLNPGPADTADAIAPDEEGGWTDYSEIGSYPAAGDTVGAGGDLAGAGDGSGESLGASQADAADVEDDQGVEDPCPQDPAFDRSVLEVYGEADDSQLQAAKEAASCGVVFELVPDAPPSYEVLEALAGVAPSGVPGE